MPPANDEERSSLRQKMFTDGNRVRFTKTVDIAGQDWWLERFFDPHGLTPESLGDLLTKSAKGEKSIVYAFVDGVGHAFRVRVDGARSGTGEIWFVERTFELAGNMFNADEMFVAKRGRQGGLGRKLMSDLIDASRLLNIDRIRIQARDIGKYAWLRMGFRVDSGSWRDMRKDLIAAVLDYADSLPHGEAMQIASIISSGGPEMANVVAAMKEPVPSRQLRDDALEPVKVPLGKALMLERTGDWSGEFVLADDESGRMAKAYLRENADA